MVMDTITGIIGVRVFFEQYAANIFYKFQGKSTEKSTLKIMQ